MTKGKRLLLAAVAVALALYAWRKLSEHHEHYQYCGAYVTGPTLVVFPFDTGDFKSVELPFGPGQLTSSADGRSLYSAGAHWDSPRYFFRVDLKTRQMMPLAPLPDLSINSMAVSQDASKILVSGQYRPSPQPDCGIFEVTVPTGKVRTVLRTEAEGCRYEHSWGSLSFSHDARSAVAVRHGEVGLIDLEQGAVKSLGKGSWAAWSPDGKWIAIADHLSSSDITLLDAHDLTVQRRFGSGDTPMLSWSPDSRYLLVWKACLLSLGFAGTLETVDVRNGRMQVIRSSRCEVSLSTEGWVSEDVVQ